MEKSSTTKANEILPEFQRSLLEKKLAPEKNVFFYALWTSKFFNFARKKQMTTESYQESAVSQFLEALESDPHISDWQIRQVGDAIRLYYFHYRGLKPDHIQVEKEGIVLKQPLKKSHLLLDWQVMKFLTRFQYAQAEGQCPREEKIRIIESAIRNRQTLEIVYLKAKDEKSRRSIKPLSIGDMEFKGHSFLGLQALCLQRQERRTFNVDRILEISNDNASPGKGGG
jgi:hypothetical protein